MNQIRWQILFETKSKQSDMVDFYLKKKLKLIFTLDADFHVRFEFEVFFLNFGLNTILFRRQSLNELLENSLILTYLQAVGSMKFTESLLKSNTTLKNFAFATVLRIHEISSISLRISKASMMCLKQLRFSSS